MKRLLVTLIIAFCFLSFSSFAKKIDVAPAALEAFQTNFKHATDVNWSASQNYYKANFVMNGQYISAYYTPQGELLALSKNIRSTDLPLMLQVQLKKNYGNFWITDLFEISNEQGTTYYITLENADTEIVLNSISTSNWKAYQKQRKS